MLLHSFNLTTSPYVHYVTELTGKTAERGMHASSCALSTKCVHIARQTTSHVNTYCDVSQREVERPYVCFECSERFLSRGELVEHLEYHSARANGQQPGFLSTALRASLNSYEEFDDHATTEHEEGQSFTCRNCDMCFVSLPTLKKHEKICEKISS